MIRNTVLTRCLSRVLACLLMALLGGGNSGVNCR
jgi:hypothetical protein